ncbi:MAG: ribosomal protein S18-alanine N-acetyltransferase [Thermoanaerobaculia bacterium]|nr:ribosomal protein S18-alanine N-acetyltransferase [Thermoanaerobaculia bacterium]
MARPAETPPREGGARDLPELARLEALAFATPWDAVQLAALLALPSTRAWLLAAGEVPRPRASALFQVVEEEAELLRVAVEPEFRQRGLARRLLEAALLALAQEGVRRVFLEVAAGNAAALALYRRLGFFLQGRRRAYYPAGEDALLLARELADPGTGRDRVLS